MMSFEHWLAFVLASTILLVIPGPTILTVIGYAATYGGKRTESGREASGLTAKSASWPRNKGVKLPLVAGVTLGDMTSVTFSLLGLGALLTTSMYWFMAVKWIGGLYLIYLGLRLVISGNTSQPGQHQLGTPPSLSRMRLFVNTYLVTALNPKGIVFFVAFLPQFVEPQGNTGLQLLILASTFVVLGSINATLYTVFASSAMNWLRSRGGNRSFNYGGGLLLMGAGLWALLQKTVRT